MGRKTKFVRVKLQFILEYDQEFDGIPSGNLVDGVCHAAAQYMANDAAKREGPQTVAWHGGRQEVGLHFPKRPPPPKAKPKKRAR